jgi:hypothetical protein
VLLLRASVHLHTWTQLSDSPSCVGRHATKHKTFLAEWTDRVGVGVFEPGKINVLKGRLRDCKNTFAVALNTSTAYVHNNNTSASLCSCSLPIERPHHYPRLVTVVLRARRHPDRHLRRCAVGSGPKKLIQQHELQGEPRKAG